MADLIFWLQQNTVILLGIALSSYAIASLVYCSVFFIDRSSLSYIADKILLVAVIVHGIDIMIHDIGGQNPATSVQEAVGALAWVIPVGYLLTTWKYRLAGLGAFIAPPALMLFAFARLSGTSTIPVDLQLIGKIHISLAIIGVGLLTMVTALSITYLIGENAVKEKRFGSFLFREGASLETLDRLTHRLMLVAFPVFTVAIMLGAVWSMQTTGVLGRIEYWLSLIAWFMFGGLMFIRIKKRWRGRKAALGVLISFLLIIVVLVFYMARGVM